MIRACFDELLRISRDATRYDSFPSVSDTLRKLNDAGDADDAEIQLLEQVFALHEVGTISEPYAQFLKTISATHRLGLVSNIWSKKDLYLREFDRVGITRLFEAGLTIPQVAMISGHKDWKNLKRYTHMKPQDLHELDLSKLRPVIA